MFYLLINTKIGIRNLASYKVKMLKGISRDDEKRGISKPLRFEILKNIF
jgi:hypothetical protein